MSDKETIFDKIRDKKAPAEILYEDEYALAFQDIQPQAPVHVLVIPKKKIVNFDELDMWTDQETSAFFRSIRKVIKHLQLTAGYRVIINTGRLGQQSVDYLHVHILSGRQLTWPPG